MFSNKMRKVMTVELKNLYNFKSNVDRTAIRKIFCNHIQLLDDFISFPEYRIFLRYSLNIQLLYFLMFYKS